MNRMEEGTLEVLQVYKLLQYVREKNKQQIQKMVRMGVPDLINLTEPKEGHGALSLASVANDEDMIQFLMSLGAHPDIQDKKGQTPVMVAAQLGHHNIMTLFAQHDANIHMRDNEGKGVLFYCISPSKAHTRCLQVALDCNANVNSVSDTGKPVLVFACEKANGCEDLILSILEKGADSNAADEVTGQTAMMEAAKAGNVRLVRAVLQKGGDPNKVNKEGLCAAHFAAERGFLEVLKVLSAYSADMGVCTTEGNTPLHFAAAGGFRDCCRFLSQRGCNPTLKNLAGQLSSKIAKDSGHVAALNELKKAERRHVRLSAPDAVNPNELWAVMLHDWSCEHEETLRRAFEMANGFNKVVPMEKFISLLQVHNAPISDENLRKIIEKHDKKQSGVIGLSQFFKGNMYLQRNFVISSYTIKQIQKRNSEEMGKSKKNKVLFALPFSKRTMPADLRKMDGGYPDNMIERYQPFTDVERFCRGRPPIPPIEDDSSWYIDEPEKKYININSCVMSGDIESLSLAFIKNVPVDVRDEFSNTPLMTACHYGNLKIAKFLIELSANVNAVDQFNQTPLHFACHDGHVDIVSMLVESGATVDSVSITGETPLMRAIKSCRFRCVEYLIRAGANVMAQNKQGQNCLDIARDYGCSIIIDVIKNATKVLKPTSSKETKIDIRGPAPSVSAAAKQDLIENLILKNPDFTMRCAIKADITYVPKIRWGKRITNSSQHI